MEGIHTEALRNKSIFIELDLEACHFCILELFLTQAHVFKAAELCLEAQEQAIIVSK